MSDECKRIVSVCKKCFRCVVCLRPHDVLVSSAARVTTTQQSFLFTWLVNVSGATTMNSKRRKKKGCPGVRGWSCPGGPPPPRPRCCLLARPSRPGRSGSVEHDGLGILVCHLSHVTKDIFFCDNTKKPPVGGDRAEGVRRRKPTFSLRERKECAFVGEY